MDLRLALCGGEPFLRQFLNLGAAGIRVVGITSLWLFLYSAPFAGDCSVARLKLGGAGRKLICRPGGLPFWGIARRSMVGRCGITLGWTTPRRLRKKSRAGRRRLIEGPMDRSGGSRCADLWCLPFTAVLPWRAFLSSTFGEKKRLSGLAVAGSRLGAEESWDSNGLGFPDRASGAWMSAFVNVQCRW